MKMKGTPITDRQAEHILASVGGNYEFGVGYRVIVEEDGDESLVTLDGRLVATNPSRYAQSHSFLRSEQ